MFLINSYISECKLGLSVVWIVTLMLFTQSFISDEQKKGRKFEELYELVQHAGNVLPRL